MPSTAPKLNLFPWIGGLQLWGSSATKPPQGLVVSEDFVYDFDGTKRRRGGQIHAHRVPLREGGAFDHEFLGNVLDTDIWTETASADVSLGLTGPSLLHVTTPGSGTSTYSITASLLDSKIRALIDSTSTPDLSLSPPETTLITITTRLRFGDETGVKIPTSGQTNGVDLLVHPGRGVTEWKFEIHFNDAGIWVLPKTGAGYQLVTSAAGLVDHLGVANSATFIDNEFHTWRFDITRTGSDYFLAIYLDEIAIYSGIDIKSALTSTSLAGWNFSTGGAVDDINIEIDYLKVDTTDVPIRGLTEFVVPQEGTQAIRYGAMYAGTQIYLDYGDPYAPRSIDTGYVENEVADFQVFGGVLVYTTTDRKSIPRKYSFGDEQGKVLEGTPPVGSILQVHANRLWISGDPEHPSRIYFSANGDFEDWGVNGGFIEVEKDDGQRVTGLGPSFRGELIVYKEKGIYRITGTGVGGSFSLVQLSKSIGCASHHSIQNVVNDQYFVSDIGVHSLITTQKFGDLESAFLSRDVRDYWRAQIDTASLRYCWAVNNEPLDRYEVLVPTGVLADGMTPNRILTLHYGLTSENFPAGLWSIKKISGHSMAMLRLPGDGFSRNYVGSASGFLNRQDQNDHFDFPVATA